MAAPPLGSPQRPSKAKASKPGDWRAEAERFARNLADLPECKEALASALGLPPTALDAIPLLGVRNRDAGGYVEYTFPETDARGTVIGVGTRLEAHGRKVEKKYVTGGKRGLTLPGGWGEPAGTAFVVEGPTDFLALAAAGLLGVGRPSNSGGGKHLAALFAEWPGELFIVGENDRKPNGDWPGRDGAEGMAKALAGATGRPVKWTMPPTDAKDVRAWLAAEARGDAPWPVRGAELAAILIAAATSEEPPGDADGTDPTQDRRKIVVDADEFRVNGEAAATLAREPELYQRGGQLVAVVEQPEDSTAEALIRRPHGAALIRPLTPAGLRERLSRCACFDTRKMTDEGVVERAAHPPGWCVGALFDRGQWPVPHLEAIVTHPAFLPNGSLLFQAGYDPESRLYFSPQANLELTVPQEPTRADVARAVETLEDAVSDFPFQTPAHKSAWVAALLTPLAWFGFDGPAPLFLIDSNVRGAGKGLLADVIAIIVFGRRFSTMAYTNDRDELRKKITSLAVEGERAVRLDNLAGAFGNDVLDNVLTSPFWKDRLLGGNKNFDGPIHATWFGTGNNVQIAADTSRRTCPIRMESMEERPELKGGFRHKELRAHVRKHRAKYLTAALTILRGWHVAGRPVHGLPNWGSFEGWSGVVREAVVFAGLPDPGATREELQLVADRDAAGMRIVLEEIRRLDPNRYGLTTADLIARCHDDSAENGELRGAIEELCGKLDGRKLGGRFKHFQRRNFGGMMLDKAGEDRTKSNRWAVFPVGPAPKPPESPPASPHLRRRPMPEVRGMRGRFPPRLIRLPMKPKSHVAAQRRWRRPGGRSPRGYSSTTGPACPIDDNRPRAAAPPSYTPTANGRVAGDRRRGKRRPPDRRLPHRKNPIMASLEKSPGGYVIRIVGTDGKRRPIRLGKLNKKQANEVKLKVEQLHALAINNLPMDAGTAAWVGELGDDLAGKLAAVGLIPDHGSRKLGEFFDHYLEGRRHDSKPSTIANIDRVVKDLKALFGPEAALRGIGPEDAESLKAGYQEKVRPARRPTAGSRWHGCFSTAPAC